MIRVTKRFRNDQKKKNEIAYGKESLYKPIEIPDHRETVLLYIASEQSPDFRFGSKDTPSTIYFCPCAQYRTTRYVSFRYYDYYYIIRNVLPLHGSVIATGSSCKRST